MLFRKSEALLVILTIGLVLLSSAGVFSQERVIPGAHDSYLDAINVPAAWANGFTGQGVHVGIIDDSFQTNHPYYADRINASLNQNFGSHSTGTLNDPNPYWDNWIYYFYDGDDLAYADYGEQDCHGVSVAGSIGAYNSQAKVYGPAYNATLSGLRIDFNNQQDGDFDKAISYKNDSFNIKNNSYGIGPGYVSLGSNITNILEVIDTDRQAAAEGVILNFSAGNERSSRYANGKDANKKGNQSNPYTIAVAATGDSSSSVNYNKYAYFSNYGANIFTTAPGISVLSSDRDDPSDNRGNNKLAHLYDLNFYSSFAYYYGYDFEYDADVPNGYTDGSYTEFSGTSASCPVVSGVMALAVEAMNNNPNCPNSSLRAMKHLLVKNSQVIDDNAESAADPTRAWTTNAAGNRFSPSYGFGQIDALALTTAASQCFEITPQTIASAWWDVDNPGLHEGVDNSEILIYASFDKGALSGSALVEIAKTDVTELDKWVTINESSREDYMRSEELALANSSSAQLSNENTSLVHSSGLDSDASRLAQAQEPVGKQSFDCFFTQDDFSDVDILVQPLEEVVMTLMISASDLSEMQLELTSPSGTTSVLAFSDLDGASQEGDLFWSFTSNAFWGENPIGKWTLDLLDMRGTFDLEMLALGSTFYMGELRVPEPATWLSLILGAPILLLFRRRAAKQARNLS